MAAERKPGSSTNRLSAADLLRALCVVLVAALAVCALFLSARRLAPSLDRSVVFDSEPADPVLRGGKLIVAPGSDFAFTNAYSGSEGRVISMYARSSEESDPTHVTSEVEVRLEMGNRKPLAVGSYEIDCEKEAGSITFSVSIVVPGAKSSCSGFQQGRVDVRELRFNERAMTSGKSEPLLALAVDFAVKCDTDSGVLRGEMRYDSKVAPSLVVAPEPILSAVRYSGPRVFETPNPDDYPPSLYAGLGLRYEICSEASSGGASCALRSCMGEYGYGWVDGRWVRH